MQRVAVAWFGVLCADRGLQYLVLILCAEDCSSLVLILCAGRSRVTVPGFDSVCRGLQ